MNFSLSHGPYLDFLTLDLHQAYFHPKDICNLIKGIQAGIGLPRSILYRVFTLIPARSANSPWVTRNVFLLDFYFSLT